MTVTFFRKRSTLHSPLTFGADVVPDLLQAWENDTYFRKRTVYTGLPVSMVGAALSGWVLHSIQPPGDVSRNPSSWHSLGPNCLTATSCTHLPHLLVFAQLVQSITLGFDWQWVPLDRLRVPVFLYMLDLHREGLVVKYWHRLRRQPRNPTFIVASDLRYTTLYNIKPLLSRPFRLRAPDIINNLSLPYFRTAIVSQHTALVVL